MATHIPTPQFPASMYQLYSTYKVRSHAYSSDPPDLMYHVGPVCEVRGHVTPVPVSVPPTPPYRPMVSEAAHHPAKSGLLELLIYESAPSISMAELQVTFGRNKGS